VKARQAAGLLAGLLLVGAAQAQGSDKASAGAAQGVPMTRHIEFTAEWDDALQTRDVPRVTALMRRARGEMPRNKFGDTPLHKLPARHEFGDALPLMTALLTHGADVHAATAGGFTPLHMAAFSTCTPCVQLLLHAGARVQAATLKHGTTPLHMSRPETRAALLAAGADIAARDKLGRVPLHTVAIPSANLMGAGVGIDVVDAHGFTPLHWAAFEGEHEAAAWLLSQGANPRLRSTAAYAYTDPILAAEWASTVTYPAGLRPYDLAKARHDEVKWSTAKFRRVWELLDKATPREGWFTR
jgi:Ankyrin repeats (3 copies)/Ankyrin repeat